MAIKPNKLGFEGKLFYNLTQVTVAGSWEATGSWVEVEAVRDLTKNMDADEVDVTSRGSGGHKQTRTALRDASIDFDLVWDGVPASEPGKAVDAFRAAYYDGTEITLAILDGDIDVAGSRGLVGNFVVTACNRAEPLSDAMIYSVTVKPGSLITWGVAT